MPADVTLTARIAYNSATRAVVSDLTKELIPLVVALDGTPITSYTVAVTSYYDQPVTWETPGNAGSVYGVLVGPGTAHILATGLWRVWVRYAGDPETIIVRADGWVQVTGTPTSTLEELAGAGAYQLRSERGEPSGYATLGVDGIVPADQLPVGLGGSDPLKQDADADLTAIAALTPSNDDVLQRKAGAWTTRTPAQVKTDLSLTKSDVGLGSVDNTADTAKPVSTAQQSALDGKAATSHTHAEADVTGLVSDLAGKAATSHTHAAGDTTSGTFAAARIPDATTGAKGSVQLAGDLAGTAASPTVPGLAGKAATSHTHAESDVTSLVSDLAGKAASSHTHAGSDVASGTVAYARLPVGTGLNTVAAGDDTRITGAAADSAVVHNSGAETVAGVKTFSSAPVVPSGAFPEAAVTGLVSDLAGKAASSHSHAESDVTSLVSDLALKAPLASPALAGTPTAPTAAVSTNTTQVATTAFVLANAGSTPDADASTKGKVQLAGDLGGTAASPTVPGLAAKAPLASPTFTGTPAAPTATAATASTQVATTAYADTAATDDVQVFTSASGTWTKPAWVVSTSRVEIIVIGDGGGGGSGCRRSTGANRSAGGGGSAGAMSRVVYPASALASTATIAVGQGGAGGAAKTVDNSDGAAGSAGTGSSVTSASVIVAFAWQGQGGAGGQAGGATSAGGVALGGMFAGTTGGGSPAGGSGAGSTSTGAAGASGGGGGGGINTSDVAQAGGTSGVAHSVSSAQSVGGVVGGASPTTAVNQAVGVPAPGTGGGGGAGNSSGVGQSGATGGRYGGGGGGGGASQNGANSGAGGNGAPGIVYITTRK